jgi:hypothetical protein
MDKEPFSFFTKASDKPEETPKQEEPVVEKKDGNEDPPVEAPKDEPEEPKEPQEPTDDPKEDKFEGLTKEKIFEALDQDENAYLEYLSKKTGRELTSLEDLKEVKEVEKEPDLPEDVKKYWEFKKETGRGFNDFLKANKDWTTESKEAVVMEHIRQKEGLEGELLKEAFELEYRPDEDSSDRERRLAEIRLEKRYNQALRDLKESQRQYALPTDEKDGQRQAAAQRQVEAEKFQQGMTEAVRGIDRLAVDDFSYKVEKDPQIEQRFSSIENILAKYKKGDSYDFKSLAETIIAGENHAQFAKAYAEHYKNKVVEDEMKKMSHQQDPTKAQPSEGPQDVSIDRVKSFFRKV